MKVSSLLLCAGLGRRMAGRENKLLAEFGGQTVIRSVATELVKAGFDEIVAVTGHDRNEVETALAGLPLRLMHNADYARGMHASIRAGLRELEAREGFVFICLGDQPLLQAADYGLLIAAARENPRAPLLYPTFEGQRGNPAVLSLTLREEILAHEDEDRGCQYLFAKYEGLAVAMPSRSTLVDIDTPELLAEARAQRKGNFHGARSEPTVLSES